MNEVKIIWVAENVYHTDAYLNSHSHHDYYQIYYVIENEAEFVVNGSTTKLSENMLIFAHPHVEHGIKPISVANALRMLEVKFIVLDDDLIEELSHIPRVFYGNDQLQKILREVVDEGFIKDFYFERSIVHLFSFFIYKMIQLNKNFNMGPSKKVIQTKPAAKIKEFINKHYRDEISLNKLAENVGYTKNYLCRLFRESTGITINEYLNTVRISHAVDMLLSSDIDVMEISKATGYTNIYHFLKTFKKMTNMSPGNYRRNSIQGEGLFFGNVETNNSIIGLLSEQPGIVGK